MEVPFFMSKIDLVVYSVLFVSRLLCQLVTEGKQLVVHGGTTYLRESAVMLSVGRVQYLSGKQLSRC